MGWLNEYSALLPFCEIGSFRLHWSSQTNSYKMYTFCFLAWRSTLLGKGNDWLAQYQYYVTTCDAGGLVTHVGQYYN